MADKLYTEDVKGRIQGAAKNLLINGDMRISQRGASFAGVGASDIYTLDRWEYGVGGSPAGRVTVSQSIHNPYNQGLRNSMLLDCSTAETFSDTGSYAFLTQKIEAFDCQRLKYGDLDAVTMAFSFWLKSDVKTGTMGLQFFQSDDSRSYTVELDISDNNWNKYIVIVPGDVTGIIDNNNGVGLWVYWVLTAGSAVTKTSSLNSWGSYSGITTSNQDNWLDSVSNNIWITGVQLEVGEAATEFDFLDMATELARCQRYYEDGHVIIRGLAYNLSAGLTVPVNFNTEKRSTPSIAYSNGSDGGSNTSITTPGIYLQGFVARADTTDATDDVYYTADWAADAEL